MFASSWQMAAVCKTNISLAHCEDKTVIGLASILHITYLHHNFTAWYDTCCFVQKDYFYLNYWNAWWLLKDSVKHVLWQVLEKIRCQLNIQISVTFSVTFALKQGFHSGISLVADEIFVKWNHEKVTVPQIFSSDLWLWNYDRFDNQTGIDWRDLRGNKTCLNAFCGQKFRQRRAKCVLENTALPCVLNTTAAAFSTK